MLDSIIRLQREVANVAHVAGGRVAVRFAAAIAASLPQILKARSLAPADKIMHRNSHLFSVNVEGVTLILPSTCFSGVREMYARGVYLAEPGFHVHSGDVVIDLGCNVGMFALLAAKIGAKVTAVDAQAGFGAALADNLARNNCVGRVTFVHALVGASTGLFADAEVLSSGSHYGAVPEIVSMAQLTEGLERVDFLKVDIEGSEFEIFSGEQPWIRKVDAIAMEVHQEFGEPARLVEWLSDAGFDVSTTRDNCYIYAARCSRRDISGRF